MNQPLVSVIVPAYNLAEYLPRTLESVLAQTLQDWECLVVDDGSTDATSEVIRNFTARDHRFRGIYQENRGLSSARNVGLWQSRGKYVQFLDADDAIDLRKLEAQVRSLSGIPEPALSITDYALLFEHHDSFRFNIRLSPRLDLKAPLRDLIFRWELGLSIPPQCFLFDARFFRDGICFEESLRNHEDWACWVHIFSLRPKIVFVPERLALYRMREKSMAHSDKTMPLGFLKAIRLSRSLFPDDSEIQALLDKKERLTKRFHSRWGWLYWRRYARILTKVAIFLMHKIIQIGDFL